MKSHPKSEFLLLKQIINHPTNNEPLIPVGKSTWWAGVRSGRYPAPIKISSGKYAWRVKDIQNLIEELSK